MKNFKEIAEKCAKGEIYGTIILNDGSEFYSKYLSQYIFNGQIVKDFYTVGLAPHLFHVDQIINFIPNNMQEYIKIDIPKGKMPVMEQTEKGINITWANKDITYKQVFDYLNENHQLIQYQANVMVNKNDSDFLRKVNVIGKLTNIRNYFGKPDGTECGFYIYKFDKNEFKVATTAYPAIYASDVVAFAKREHAEQAIKMLGDELKYLFEPW